MKHVVMFSGGIGSWAAAKLVAKKYGTEDLYLLFTDVKGDAESPHIGEDEDTYRFLDDAVKNIGGHYIYLNEGRDIWQVFKDNRFLGNSRLAKCSHVLKQKPARTWINENVDPEDSVIYVGIDWTETHRLPAIVKNYLPYKVEAPFSHNNCGGGCVRAGQGQFKKLLEVMPERFAMWEAKEQEVREYLDKDVAILSEVKNGIKKPLPLIELRRRVEDQPQLVDELDIGGCGCFFEEDEREVND